MDTCMLYTIHLNSRLRSFQAEEPEMLDDGDKEIGAVSIWCFMERRLFFL